MYLGSRPAASVARWMARPDVAAMGFLVPDCYMGWPVNHGQPLKHHVRSHCVAASSSLRDDVALETKNSTPLTFSQDFTDYHRWPKSEFELAIEENSILDSYGEDNLPTCQDANLESNVLKNRNSDDMIGSVSQPTRSAQRSCFSDSEATRTEEDEATSRPGQEDLVQMSSSSKSYLFKSNSHSEEKDVLSTDLMFQNQGRTLTSSVTSSVDTRKTSTFHISSSRRRVHPVGKFADELVNWMPQVESSTDEEKDQNLDEDFNRLEHCMEESNVSATSINSFKRTKRPSRLSRHQTKRKRINLTRAVQQQHQQQHRLTKDGLNRRRKQHNPWSVDETRMLIEGVTICGEGKWADIKRLDFKELASRSPVDLKDKWRNLLRLAQLTQNHPRARKVEKRTDLPSELLQKVRRLSTQQK